MKAMLERCIVTSLPSIYDVSLNCRIAPEITSPTFYSHCFGIVEDANGNRLKGAQPMDAHGRYSEVHALGETGLSQALKRADKVPRPQRAEAQQLTRVLVAAAERFGHTSSVTNGNGIVTEAVGPQQLDECWHHLAAQKQSLGVQSGCATECSSWKNWG